MKLKNFIKRTINYLLHGIPIVEHVSANIVSLDTNCMLKGRVALITGGTSGIGKAIATAFLNSGADVIITGRNLNRVNSTIAELEKVKSQAHIYGIELDNSKTTSFERKLQDILEIISPLRIDVLVNNAGIGGGDISCTTEEEFDQVIQTNLKGTFFLSRVIARYMIEH